MDFELRGEGGLNIAQVKDLVSKAVMQRLAKCALLVEGEAKRSLSRGGRQPGKGGKGVVVYEVGALGEPPRLRTGNLRASIRTEKTSEGSYVVGPTTTAFYGAMHEFGGRIKVTPKMRMWMGMNLGIWLRKETAEIIVPKRPFMKPALDKMVEKFPELFKDIPLGGSGA